MADFNLDITTLCVGQGLSVLIELKIEEETHFVGLLDCGTFQKEINVNENYKSALTRILNAIANNGNKLNYLHISHFDADHFNLLGKLKESFGNKIPLDKVVFGSVTGERGKIDKQAAKYRRIIENNFDVDEDKIYSVEHWRGLRLHSPYHNPELEVSKKIAYVSDIFGNGYVFKIIPLLFHPHLLSKKMTGLDEKCPSNKGLCINAGSSVLLITLVKKEGDIPQASYIFTGDAIAYTYRILNAQIFLEFKNENKMLLISHHGGRRNIARTGKEIDSLDNFLTKIQPTAAVVSAQSNGNWDHPNSQVIAQYKQFRSIEQTNGHKFTSLYKKRSTTWVESYNMKKRIYQTCYINNLSDEKSECSKITPDWMRQHIIMHVEGSDDSIKIKYDTEPIG